MPNPINTEPTSSKFNWPLAFFSLAAMHLIDFPGIIADYFTGPNPSFEHGFIEGSIKATFVVTSLAIGFLGSRLSSRH